MVPEWLKPRFLLSVVERVFATPVWAKTEKLDAVPKSIGASEAKAGEARGSVSSEPRKSARLAIFVLGFVTWVGSSLLLFVKYCWENPWNSLRYSGKVPEPNRNSTVMH
jgi:hypothetical protein